MIRFRTSTPSYVQADLAATLIHTFTSHELSMMSQLGTVIDLEPGSVFTTEGELGREALVILSGTAAVSRDDEAIGTVGPSEIVGEMSLLSGERRNATIVATTPVKVAVFTRREFHALLDSCPRLDRLVHRLADERSAS